MATPLKNAAKTLAAIVAAMLLAFVLVVAVEYFSSIVHPFPANFDGNIPEHVRRYPHWVLAVVVPMWGATSAAAVWLAMKIGRRPAGIVVTLLLGSAIIFNLSMLPYTLWFKIVMPTVFAIACWLGFRYGHQSVAKSK